MAATLVDFLTPSVLGGELAAFQELNRARTNKLTARIYRITGNWQDAEDVVQDAMLRAYEQIDRFEGRSKFSTWLTRIATNFALMGLRKKRYIELPIHAGPDEGLSTPQWEPKDVRDTPEQNVVNREREYLLNEAILKLRPRFREVIELQQDRGYTMKEMATILGTTVPTIKARVYRAREELRSTLLAVQL